MSEKSSIARIAELGTIEKRLVKTNSARFIVNLDDEPVLYSDLLDPVRRRKLRGTNGMFFVKYDPDGCWNKSKYKYLLQIGDLYAVNLRVANLNHLYKLSTFIPELAWVIRNTNFNDQLFAIAKAHPGMPVPFCLDAPRYYNMILKKMNAAGIDPTENKPFVTFKFADNLPHITVDVEALQMPECKKYYFAALEKIEKENTELVTTNQ